MAKRATDLDMLGNRVTNLPAPSAASDAVTKEYVDGNSLFRIVELENGEIALELDDDGGRALFRLKRVDGSQYEGVELHLMKVDSVGNAVYESNTCAKGTIITKGQDEVFRQDCSGGTALISGSGLRLTDTVDPSASKVFTTDGNVATLPSKTSDLTNDSGFLTEAPVKSVNGQTGDVVVSASMEATAITDGTDLNTLTTPGTYYCNYSTVTNAPDGSTAFTLIVAGKPGSKLTQMMIDNNQKVWQRMSSGGDTTWWAWYQCATTREMNDELANYVSTVDTAMSDTSENPVQNKVIKAYIDGLVGNVATQLSAI